MGWRGIRAGHVRIALAVLIAVGLVPVGIAYVDAYTAPPSESPDDVPAEIPPADGITVVTIDGLGPGQIVAYAPNGSMLYRNRTYRFYHDVDPSPVGRATVTYVASTEVDSSRCEGDGRCSLSVIERVNLTTGEVTRLYERAVPDFGTDNVHDVDRVNDTVWLIADIAYPDRVYMVNVTTDEVIWEWKAVQGFDPESGGDYPRDWTHLNDVEYLDDGLVMVSIRNQDQVIFLRPGEGIVDDMTLGSEDARSVLYEQHNPDYIPEENGGPAVLVADSENNRIVEYQRRNGEWRRSWLWRDDDMQWPRDADRLPNGHTLITDTHSDRVMELDEDGRVVWSFRLPGPYEAERLGTGPESAGGPSAVRADLPYRNGATGPINLVLSVVPAFWLHSTMYVLPNWMTPLGAVGVLLTVTTLLAWAIGEGVRVGLAWVR